MVLSDLYTLGIGLVGIVLVLIQISIYGFDFDDLFFEKEEE